MLLLGRIAAGERLLGTVKRLKTLELGTRKALSSTLAVSPLVQFCSLIAPSLAWGGFQGRHIRLKGMGTDEHSFCCAAIAAEKEQQLGGCGT